MSWTVSQELAGTDAAHAEAAHTEAAHRSHTCLVEVEGSEDDRRRLSIDFAGFTEKLRQTSPLDHDRLGRLIAGVDLINGLAGPSEAGFGRATPKVGKETELSDQLGAITDMALEAAEEILEAAPVADDEFEDEQLQAPAHATELSLALSRLGNDEISAARQALLRSKPATERAVAEEFI